MEEEIFIDERFNLKPEDTGEILRISIRREEKDGNRTYYLCFRVDVTEFPPEYLQELVSIMSFFFENKNSNVLKVISAENISFVCFLFFLNLISINLVFEKLENLKLIQKLNRMEEISNGIHVNYHN